MIRERLLVLRERRSMLIAHAADQRMDAMRIVRKIERATAWFDRARSMALKLRAHPVLIAGGIALLVAMRPRKALKLFATGYSLWQGWRNLRSMIDRLAPAQPRRAYRAT